jgi:hypothetical protein
MPADSYGLALSSGGNGDLPVVLDWPTAPTSVAAAKRRTSARVRDPLPHMPSARVPRPDIQYGYGLPRKARRRRAVRVLVRAGRAGRGLANVGKGVPLGVIAASWPLYLVKFEVQCANLYYCTHSALEARIKEVDAKSA